MGRRNLKALTAYDTLSNTPQPSRITDPFNNLSLEWWTTGNDFFTPIDSSSLVPVDVAAGYLGGFSFWIKITDDVVNYAGSGGQVGIMCVNGHASVLNARLNVNLIDVAGVTHAQLQVLTGTFPSITLSSFTTIPSLLLNRWHNITVKYDVISGVEKVSIWLDNQNPSNAWFAPADTLYSSGSHYWIGVTAPSTLNPSLASYLGFAKLNHFVFCRNATIDPALWFNNGLPFIPDSQVIGLDAIHTVRSSVGAITNNRIGCMLRLGGNPNIIDFVSAPNIFAKISIDEIYGGTLLNNLNQYTRTVKQAYTWDDTTDAIHGQRAFSVATPNGMFMRPAYLAGSNLQPSVGIKTTANSIIGNLEKQITSWADNVPMMISYVNDWPNAPSVFGGEGSLYQKAHNNTYPSKTLGTITVNNYKAVAPTKRFFNLSFG